MLFIKETSKKEQFDKTLFDFLRNNNSFSPYQVNYDYQGLMVFITVSDRYLHLMTPAIIEELNSI